MLARYCGPGLLGLGITALIAGFMSGMAGNVSAFATVWTYDIYGALINKHASDESKVKMGRWCTLLGVAVSIGTAYLVMQSHSIMDYVQALFSFFIAPLFGTVLLGMLWKRATPAGGFWGLFAGTLSSVGMWAWAKVDPGAVKYVALSLKAQDQAQNMFRALWCWVICVVVTVVVSLTHQAQARRRIDGSGLRLDHHSARGARFGFPPAGFLGGGCRRCVCHPANHFLVGRNNEIRWFLVDMVLHRLVDAGERNFDHRRGPVGGCHSCGQSSVVAESPRQYLVGRAVASVRRGLLLPFLACAGTGAECR